MDSSVAAYQFSGYRSAGIRKQEVFLVAQDSRINRHLLFGLGDNPQLFHCVPVFHSRSSC